MKKLTTKIQDFNPGKKIFLSSSGAFEISEAMELPSGTILGAELPNEDGNYYINTPNGAFVIKVQGEEVCVSTYFSSRSGSFNDGTFRLNSPTNYALPLTEESIFSTGINMLDRYYDSILENEEYIVLNSLRRNFSNVFTGCGFLKINKETYDTIMVDENEQTGPNPYDYVASMCLGGTVYFEYGMVELANGDVGDDEGTILFLDYEKEEIRAYPAPEVEVSTNGMWVVLAMGENEIGFVGSNHTSIYRFENGVPTHLGNFVHTNTPGENAVYYMFAPQATVKYDSETVYITSADGVLRAVDKNTYMLRWELTDVHSIGGQLAQGIILANGNYVSFDGQNDGSTNTYIFREYSKTDGSVVNTWTITDSFPVLDYAIPSYVDSNNSMYSIGRFNVIRTNLTTGVSELFITGLSQTLERNYPSFSDSEGRFIFLDSFASLYMVDTETDTVLGPTLFPVDYDMSESVISPTTDGIYVLYRLGTITTLWKLNYAPN